MGEKKKLFEGMMIRFALFLAVLVSVYAEESAVLDDFDIPEARTAAVLAATAYCDLEDIRGQNCAGLKALGPNFEMLYASHARADTLMFVGRFKKPNWRRDPGDVVVVFRGTVGLQKLNWQLNLAKQKVPSFYEGIPGRLHKGFLTGFYVQFPALQHVNPHKFKMLMNVFKRAGRILVCGHSLGGAMAVNMQAYLFSHPEIETERVWLYTFGSPRVGDKAFAAYMDKAGAGRSFRVVHGRDPVPSVPPRVASFRHSGQLVWFEHGNGWTRETMHADSKRRWYSFSAVGDHSNYMGVNEACDPEVFWDGVAKDLSAAAQGITDHDKLYIAQPQKPEEVSDGEDIEAGGEIIEEEKGGWISRFLDALRDFKDKWDSYDEIHDNLSKVDELWDTLLEDNVEYAERVTAYFNMLKEKRRQRLQSRRRGRA